MKSRFVSLLCAAVISIGHLVALWVPLAVLGGPVVVSAADCESLLGTWEQSHFGQPGGVMNEASDSIKLVITEISASCQFKATFDGNGFTHAITGTIGSNSNGGTMTIVRTDPSGCTNRLFGKMFQIAPGAFRPVGGLEWWITSSEPKCGMGPGHKEARSWKRP